MFRLLRPGPSQKPGYVCLVAVVVRLRGLAGMPAGISDLVVYDSWPGPAAPAPGPPNLDGAENSFTMGNNAADGGTTFGDVFAANRRRMAAQAKRVRDRRQSGQTGVVVACLNDPGTGLMIADDRPYFRAVSADDADKIAESIRRGDKLPVLSDWSDAGSLSDAAELVDAVQNQVDNGSRTKTLLTSFTLNPAVAKKLSGRSVPGSVPGGVVIEMLTAAVPDDGQLMLDVRAVRGLSEPARAAVERLEEYHWLGKIPRYRVVFRDGKWTDDCDLAVVQLGGGGPIWDGNFIDVIFAVTNASISDETSAAVVRLGGTISTLPVSGLTTALIYGPMLRGRGQETTKRREAIGRGLPLISLDAFTRRVEVAEVAAAMGAVE